MRFWNLRFAALTAVLTIGSLGCGINPALIGGFTGNSTNNLQPPTGSIVIVAMNRTPAPALVRLVANKQYGGQIAINLSTFGAGDVNNRDYMAVVQDCDIQSIEFIDIIVQSQTATIPFAFAPLVAGETLSCGKVVAITLEGTAPNIVPTVVVF